MIEMFLKVRPSSTTAQQKGIRIVNGRPMFFKKSKVVREGNMLVALLSPYRPQAPYRGPLSLEIGFTFPHLKSAPKKILALKVPKETRSDLDNLSKELIDLFAKLGFIEDDAQIARMLLEKWHGPEDQVGIRIRIAPIGAEGE
jgi:Holliday junction resolvase RusA-like endonuclease